MAFQVVDRSAPGFGLRDNAHPNLLAGMATGSGAVNQLCIGMPPKAPPSRCMLEHITVTALQQSFLEQEHVQIISWADLKPLHQGPGQRQYGSSAYLRARMSAR